MKAKVKEWLAFAELDYKSAEKLNEDEHLTASAAFHCQQAVEKFIKALIELSDQSVPRTHNLQALMGLVMEKFALSFDQDLLDRINDVYIDARYPAATGLIPEGIPRRETIQEFLSFINLLKNQIQVILNQ